MTLIATRPRTAASRQSDVPDWRHDPKVLDIAKRRAEANAKAAALRTAVENARVKVSASAKTSRRQKAELLLGRTTLRALAEAATAELERLTAELADLEASLPAYDEAVSVVELEAKAPVAEALRTTYRAAIEKFDRALAEASAAANEVTTLALTAEAQFNGQDGTYRSSLGFVGSWWTDELALPGHAQFDPYNRSKWQMWRLDLSELGWLNTKGLN